MCACVRAVHECLHMYVPWMSSSCRVCALRGLLGEEVVACVSCVHACVLCACVHMLYSRGGNGRVHFCMHACYA